MNGIANGLNREGVCGDLRDVLEFIGRYVNIFLESKIGVGAVWEKI